MVFDPALILMALFLAGIGEALTEALAVPVFDYFNGEDGKPLWPRLPLLYISWAISGVIVFASGINLLAAVFADPLTGQVLTAVIAGRGSNFLHEIFERIGTRPGLTFSGELSSTEDTGGRSFAHVAATMGQDPAPAQPALPASPADPASPTRPAQG